MPLKPTLRTPLLTLLALVTTAVFAHAELESSTPDDGQTVNTAPTAVELVFSESVEVSVSTFKVYPLPDDLAAAEADAVRQEGLEPASDTDDGTDDANDDTTGDVDDDSDDSASDQATDDHDDASSDDTGSDDSDDPHALDESGGELATFVESALGNEGDEAERVDTGVSSQGSEISIELTGDLEAGWYVAMWRALSSDGHPVEGYVTFNYEP